MNSRTPIRNAIWAATILLAFGTLGSNGTSGSCADLAGPGYGTSGSGFGSTGYGSSDPGAYGQAGSSVSSAGGQTYYQPTVNNYRVDWCLNWGSNCGGPAASSFCQQMGYSHATAWTQAQNIGSYSPTLVLGDGAVCNQPGCNGFDSITCANAAQAPAPAAVQAQQATFFEEPGTNRPGMDYRNVILNYPDPKDCKNLCRKEGKCRAFTYMNPGVQGPEARCWLKNSVPAPVADGCCHSGVKR